MWKSRCSPVQRSSSTLKCWPNRARTPVSPDWSRRVASSLPRRCETEAVKGFDMNSLSRLAFAI